MASLFGMNLDHIYKLFEGLNTKINKIEGRIDILEQENKKLKQENKDMKEENRLFKQEIIQLNNRLDKKES